MGAYEIALAVALGLWLLASVAAQLGPVFPGVLGWHRRCDVLGIVPRYNYFAPSPMTHDYHLLVRTTSVSGECGRWREVTPTLRQRWWHIAWHPDRRPYKQMVHLARALTADQSVTPLATSYLLVLGYVTAQLQTADSALSGRDHVQFLIARTAGERAGHSPETVFLSQSHRICR